MDQATRERMRASLSASLDRLPVSEAETIARLKRLLIDIQEKLEETIAEPDFETLLLWARIEEEVGPRDGRDVSVDADYTEV